MRHLRVFIVAGALLLSACAKQESYGVTGGEYAVGDKNIALFKWRISVDPPPMGHGLPKTVKAGYFPFIYSRANGVLKFERYCEPTKMNDPHNDAEEASIQSVGAIEKSCNVKGVRLISYDEAGRPMGANNLSGTMSLTANVQSPQTGLWTRPSIRFEKPSKPFWW